MIMKKPFKVTNLLLSALLIASLSACSDSDSNNAQNTDRGNSVIPSVEAVQARFGSLPLVERFSGNVRSENQVPLYPQISGTVEQVFVRNGQYVEKGEKLVQLNTDVLQKQLQQAEAGYKINNAQLKQSKAQLAEVQSEFKRTKQLEEKDLTSDVEVEQIEAQLLSAEANVELAEARLEQAASLVEERRDELDKAVIRAPISGTVGQRNAEIGMQANTGTQLFLIGDLTKLKVEIILTENMLNKIQVGQSARIIVENGDGQKVPINAKLSRISPFLNEITRSTEAEIDVDNVNGLLRPGMFVPVDIFFGESQQATLIPVSALYTDPTSGEQGVFIASSLGSEIKPVSDTSNNGAVRPRSMTEPTPVQFKPVDVIAQGRMELGVNGLESGQWIVTVGQDLLSEGRTQARIRTMSWERIFQLQQLQREDLLKEIMQERDGAQNNVTL
ncbi:MAG: efflux transporter periplasmic adaptor subunit [Balneola sp.]|jgi:RND family efflux transporter MFP subunit|nr:efflux transporter periplasmic adaptor subunit [Balneola sp.]MAL18924.1 efflux transporter periplasmic adaptor subunit [Balneola sp.]MBE78779.1 efflux transporter periplasmic adaptor subunit [Balneola sp.]HBX64951.1 efflux RND transporter periplasmic adaptor subunit [Balneolaceae bacterium]|tara:strand:+ start:1103 stop:2437 length:1335 start_codon:yes stop_codon:yes gene_type:complete